MNETLVFGQTPTVSPITPEEFSQSVQNRVTPLGEYFNAVTYGAFQHSIPGVVYENSVVPDDDRTPSRAPGAGRSGVAVYDRTNVPVMSDEDYKASEFYRKGVPNDGRMTESRAKAKAEVFDEDQYRAWARNNRPWGVATVGAAVAGSVIGAAPDPTNYIPVFGPAFRAANATRIGVMMARAGIGALENAAITAVVDPVVASSRRQFGEDMSFADQVMDVALAGLFGAGVGAIHGRFGHTPERIEDRSPAKVSGALQTLGSAADALANDRPLDIAGPFRRALLEGTSAGRTERFDPTVTARTAVDVPEVDLRTSGLNAPAFTGAIETPTLRPNGEPAVYPADLVGFKSEVNRSIKAAAAEGRTLELRDMPDGRKELVETSAATWIDQYPDEATARTNLNRMAPDERKGVDVVPVETQARGKGFALIKGATQTQIEAIRSNPTLAERVRQPVPADQSAVPLRQDADPASFGKAMQETARPISDVATTRSARGPAPRSSDAIAQDAPLTSPERVAGADAAVGKPETLSTTGFKERTAEHGLDETGGFEEMADLKAINENLTKEEQAAMKDADATVAKADDYAKAYQAAASCLMKAAE